MSETEGQGMMLVKIGAIVLLIQNAILVAFLQADVADSLLELVLYIDILGFTLLGVGFLLTGMADTSENKNNYLFAGVGFLGWVLMRVWWQFILIEDLANLFISDTGDAGDLEDILNDMLTAFLLTGVFLMVGAYFASKTSAAGTMMLVYGLVNLIAVLAIWSFSGIVFGIILKFLVVPILGVVAFLKLFQAT